MCDNKKQTVHCQSARGVAVRGLKFTTRARGRSNELRGFNPPPPNPRYFEHCPGYYGICDYKKTHLQKLQYLEHDIT